MSDLFNAAGLITAVSIGASILITVIVLFFVFRVIRNITRVNSQAANILATGEPGEGTVLQLMDTGTRVNDNPMVALLMEIRSASRPPYQVQVRTFVPMIKLAQVQPGMKIAVRIDQGNPANVAVALM